MKKFSKVKYFGAVAAALLAVAPIAAPVVSQVAAPVTVQAAAAQPNGSGNQEYANRLDTVFKNTVNSSVPLTKGADFFQYYINRDNQPGSINDPNNFTSLFVTNGVDVGQLGAADGNQIQFASKDFNSADKNSILKEFQGSSRTVYNFTIILKNSHGATLATKDVTLNINRNSKAVATDVAFKVGDSVKSLDAPTAAAAATTLTNADGTSTKISDSDISALTYTNTSDFSAGAGAGNQQTIAQATFTNGQKVTNNGSTFANNGTFYQVIKLPSTLFAPGGKYSTVDAASIGTKNPAAIWVAGDGLYIRRTVNVTTGTNDQAYFPIVKYTTGQDSATSNTTTTSYYNGDTISDAALKYTAGASMDSDAFYGSVYDSLIALFGNAKVGANPLSRNLYGYENSIKLGGLDTPLPGWNSYALAGVTGANASTPPAKDAVKAAIAKIIPNPYAEGTYNVPLTVTNGRNLQSTVNIPVVIGTNVGAPVATEFVGYSTVVKGDKFDALADVQFKNSSIDNGVIPNSRIKVTSNVDTTTPGTYTVTYVVTNAAGKSATFTRTVVVTAGDLTESNASGVVYINNASGAKVYSDTATSKETGNTLDNTTAWKYSSVVKDNAGKIVAYNLGGKQYVKAADVATSPVKAQAGVFTVHYPANAKWSIAVYNSDLKVIKLIPANSTWATFGTKTLKDGKSYYNLGGNQFARTDYGFWNAK